MIPINNKGYKLLHDGCVALAQVEANGIKIDTAYLDRAINHTTGQIKKLTTKMKKDKIYKLWKKNFGVKTNIGSNEQLGKILFNVMGFKCSSFTNTGRPQVNNITLMETELPFAKRFIRLEQLKKARGTFLKGILKETTDGYLHPFFGLNIAQTYRGNSSDPNFQNVPVRDPVIKKLVRRAFMARLNHRIIEVDYNGAEICCAACYHKDPNMIAYIKDETKDLHKDMARQLYKLSKKEMTPKNAEDAKRIKMIRYCGKNMYVFPEFYGDYYLHCAKNLWEAITQLNLHTRDGNDLYSHLESKGIYELGRCDPNKKPRKRTFERYVKIVEEDFWNRKFKVYGQWKKDWWYEYLDKGYFDTLTGFRIEGSYARNEVINYPVQGSAFHWLLWSLIRIQKILNKHKMKSLIVGQIHDSIVGDVHKKEVRNYLEIVNKVMTIDVKKHWKWINVPLSIEAEMTPVNGNWYEKEEVEI